MSLIWILVSSYLAASLLCTASIYCACVLAGRKQPTPLCKTVHQHSHFGACGRASKTLPRSRLIFRQQKTTN